jgi:hypothetical protein
VNSAEMKTIFISFLLCFLIGSLLAQNTNNAAAIRQQMAQIRKSTNWDDPVAAKKANEQIQELSKKMMMTGPDPANMPSNLTEEQKEEAKKESADDKMKMWGQIIKGVEQGDNADILLAEPVREEIKEEYKKDDEPVTSSPMFQEMMTMLFIDMSQPTVQALIGQMENFKSIKTLIITGGKYGAPVNLEMLVSKAKNYPLGVVHHQFQAICNCHTKNCLIIQKPGAACLVQQQYFAVAARNFRTRFA